MGLAVVLGRCWMCKVPFLFDAERVPSVLIDPVTGLAPDLGGNPDRAQREPVCPRCCEVANVHRRRAGLELLDERDSLAAGHDRD